MSEIDFEIQDGSHDIVDDQNVTNGILKVYRVVIRHLIFADLQPRVLFDSRYIAINLLWPPFWQPFWILLLE